LRGAQATRKQDRTQDHGGGRAGKTGQGTQRNPRPGNRVVPNRPPRA